MAEEIDRQMTQAAAAARALKHAKQADVCDSEEPWSHGTILRASRYPTFYSYNLVRVERDPGMDVAALAELADRALTGLEHRRIDFESAAVAEPLRAGFRAAGWRTMQIAWLRHEGPLPPAPDIAVEPVSYDAAAGLRSAWHREDNPGVEEGDFPAAAREVALRHGASVFVVRPPDGGPPVGYAQVERAGAGAEVSHVYVAAEHRGRGLGKALTGAALRSAADAGEVWIEADTEDRAQRLYERLGFRVAWTVTEMTRWP